MDKIKPSEVSEVLLQQLQGISQGQNFDEVGTVLTGLTNFLSSRTALWLS